MRERANIPSWALERTTYIGASLACGAVIAFALSAVAIASSDTIGQWLTGFFSSLALPVLLACVLLVGGLRRIVLGSARKQKVPAKWWVVAYVLTRLPLFAAFVLLAVAAAVAWAFGSPQRDSLVQALVLLVALSATFTFGVKTVGNVYLLARHWHAQ